MSQYGSIQVNTGTITERYLVPVAHLFENQNEKIDTLFIFLPYQKRLILRLFQILQFHQI